jgi:ATP-dependent exoDNAse (exonuclease V) beta subunit
VQSRIADTFTDSLARLTGDEQKAAKTTAFDLQLDPSAPGLRFHKHDKTYAWAERRKLETHPATGAAQLVEIRERIGAVSDESDLQEVYDTERHLLYVACTRARDRLLVTGVEPASEFLDDLRSSAAA